MALYPDSSAGPPGPQTSELPIPDLDEAIPESWLDEPVQGRTRLHICKTLADLPDTDDCPVCGERVLKALLIYETPFRNKGQLFLAVCDQVPGFRCPACLVETYDPEAVAQAVQAAYMVACDAGDSAVVDYLDSLISVGAS